MPTLAPHPPVPVVRTSPDDWHEFTAATPPASADLSEVVRAAGRARRLLPEAAHDLLADLGDDTLPDPLGALLIRGVPVGDLPATPVTPGARTGKDNTSEFALLSVARSLGQPVGYLPEHGGSIVQDLVPTAASAHQQVSTSSAVELEFHTETAFHPHRPRYLLLLCLRGDPNAGTLLCNICDVVDQLDPEVRSVLAQPRFRTGVDESFTDGRPAELRDPAPVLRGDPRRPELVFDAGLMHGTDAQADAALAVLAEATRAARVSVTLEAGDLLVVDNHLCIHGRTPFAARFDGTDRWLQRSFVVADLGPSADERDGRVITTTFV